MARRTKRLWTDEEKRSICFQTKAAGVSVAQVARRYGMNANLIFRWLRDPNFSPDCASDPTTIDLKAEPAFLPVEVMEHGQQDVGSVGKRSDIARSDIKHSAQQTARQDVAVTEVGMVDDQAGGVIEINLACGHRLRISGAFNSEALARLIRNLSA